MTLGPKTISSSRDDSEFLNVLDAAKRGEEWAWESLYGDLVGPVTGYLRSRGSKDAEDVASEVFLQVARDVTRFDGPESKFRSWVFVIAHRRLLDERRAESRRPETVMDPLAQMDAFGGNVEEDVMEELALGRVSEIFETLTDEQRTVLTLRLVGDLTLEETASVMGKRVGAIKALQRRALLALKNAIESGAVSL